MERPRFSRALLQLGVALLVVAAAAGVWEILASQVPSSPAHAGVLPGPVAQLRSTAVLLGLIVLVGACVLPLLPGARSSRWLIAGTYVGAILTIGALTYGAATGMMGIQAVDPRPDATALFWARTAGMFFLGVCLLVFTLRVFTLRRERDV